MKKYALVQRNQEGIIMQRETFNSKEEAMKEIENLAKILVKEVGGSIGLKFQSNIANALTYLHKNGMELWCSGQPILYFGDLKNPFIAQIEEEDGEDNTFETEFLTKM